MKLGDKVTCTAMLKRRAQYIKESDWHVKKYWDRLAIKARDGLFLGMRQLSNGERWYEDDAGAVYEPKERFGVALVVFSGRENPVYVPLDAIMEAANG